MNIPTDFRASLLDIRKQIDRALEPGYGWTPTNPQWPQDGFCLGNWRITPRFQQNTPSESPEASRAAFYEWFQHQLTVGSGNISLGMALSAIAWEAWQASRAQLNSPSQHPVAK